MLMAVIHILESKMKFKRFIKYCRLCKEEMTEHNERYFSWSKERQMHCCKTWTDLIKDKSYICKTEYNKNNK